MYEAEYLDMRMHLWRQIHHGEQSRFLLRYVSQLHSYRRTGVPSAFLLHQLHS